jgi:hypothetical protein
MSIDKRLGRIIYIRSDHKIWSLIAGTFELVYLLLCTKEIRARFLTIAIHRERGCVTYGTNFRHTVEFSRSGRTPSPAFQPAPGQPVKRYSVRFAVSNSPPVPNPSSTGGKSPLQAFDWPHDRHPLRTLSGSTLGSVRRAVITVEEPHVQGQIAGWPRT